MGNPTGVSFKSASHGGGGAGSGSSLNSLKPSGGPAGGGWQLPLWSYLQWGGVRATPEGLVPVQELTCGLTCYITP